MMTVDRSVFIWPRNILIFYNFFMFTFFKNTKNTKKHEGLMHSPHINFIRVTWYLGAVPVTNTVPLSSMQASSRTHCGQGKYSS